MLTLAPVLADRPAGIVGFVRALAWLGPEKAEAALKTSLKCKLPSLRSANPRQWPPPSSRAGLPDGGQGCRAWLEAFLTLLVGDRREALPPLPINPGRPPHLLEKDVGRLTLRRCSGPTLRASVSIWRHVVEGVSRSFDFQVIGSTYDDPCHRPDPGEDE